MLNDLINENTKVISDTHLDHDKIIEFCPSRKIFPEEFNSIDEYIIHNMNEDENVNLLHLGDFSFKGIDKYKGVFKANTIFMRGNHETKSNMAYQNIFKHLVPGIVVNINGKDFLLQNEKPDLAICYIKDICGKRILFSHFALFHECQFDKARPFYEAIEYLEKIFIEFNCDLNIHGHIHEAKPKREDICINVSAEAIGFKPRSIKDLIEYHEKGLSWI